MQIYFKVGAIAALVSFWLSACLNAPQTPTQENLSLLSVAEIAKNYDSLKGKIVSVRNDVRELLEDRIFTLDKDQILGGETVLVFDTSPKPLHLPQGEGTEVWVRGKVADFSLADLQREYDLDLDPNLYKKYENKPAIAASSIMLSPDPGDITPNAEIYYNKRLAVKGEVEDIQTSGIFELDEEQLVGGEDLLVINTKSKTKVQNEQTVLVIGTLRPFISAEFERDYDLEWDLSLKQQLEAEYEKKPALVADQIDIVKSSEQQKLGFINENSEQ